jgi:hypothetical protein
MTCSRPVHSAALLSVSISRPEVQQPEQGPLRFGCTASAVEDCLVGELAVGDGTALKSGSTHCAIRHGAFRFDHESLGSITENGNHG